MKNLLIIVLLALLTSCGKEIDYTFTSDKMELRQLKQSTETTASSSGWYFLVAASYKSEEHVEQVVKVFAKVDGRYRYIEMPLEQIRIVINNDITIPYIEAEKTVYDLYIPNIERIKERYTTEKLLNSYPIFIITCPEQYLPQNLIPLGL